MNTGRGDGKRGSNVVHESAQQLVLHRLDRFHKRTHCIKYSQLRNGIDRLDRGTIPVTARAEGIDNDMSKNGKLVDDLLHRISINPRTLAPMNQAGLEIE